MSRKVKIRKLCPGQYVTTNTVPEVTISRQDESGSWLYAYETDGWNEGLWPTKRDCVAVIQEIVDGADEDFAHPIRWKY